MKVTGLRLHGTYETARAVSGFVAAIGWILIGVAVLIVIGGLAAGPPFTSIISGIGIGVGGMGLLQVVGAQMLRATVDTADYARQALILQAAALEGLSTAELDTSTSERSRGSYGDYTPPQSEAKKTGPKKEISSEMSFEAITALRRIRDNGYRVSFGPEKKTVVVATDDFHASFSWEEEIIEFAGRMRA